MMTITKVKTVCVCTFFISVVVKNVLLELCDLGKEDLRVIAQVFLLFAYLIAVRGLIIDLIGKCFGIAYRGECFVKHFVDKHSLETF